MSEIHSSADVSRLMEHRTWVRALARRLLADENAVDDVEQETWIAALLSGPDEPRALRSWLGSVASRFALQRLRGEGRRARRETSGAAAAARLERPSAEVVAEADAHGRVVQEVLAMAEPYRTTVLLRYFEGLSVPEVARRMDVPVETVRTRLRRAHERLRDRLVDPRRPLAVVLAPLGVGGGALVGTAAGGGAAAGAAGAAATASAPASLGLGAALAGTAAVVAVVVGGIGAGAWLLGDGGGAGNAAPGALVADDDGGAKGGAGGAGGAPAQQGQQAPPPPTSPQDAPRTAEQTPPAKETDAATTWVVRDLADGSPLAGIDLRIVRKAESAPGATTAAVAFVFDTVSDSQGWISVRRQKGDLVVLARSAGWFVAARTPPTSAAPADAATAPSWSYDSPDAAGGATLPAGEQTVWLYRKGTVTGVVRSSDPQRPLDPSKIRLKATPGWNTLGRAASAVPTHYGWYLAHGIERNRDLEMARTDGDGRFSLDVPLLGAMHIAASAPGFRGAATSLGLRPGRALSELELVLTPGVKVSGRLRTADGTPIRQAWVQVDSVRQIAASTLEPVLANGGTFGGGAEGGRATTHASDRTDVRGSFEIDVVGDGTATLFARPPGFVPVRRALGVPTQDVTALDIVLEPSSGGTVRLHRAGKDAAGETLTLQDTDYNVSGWQMRTDATGRARTDWLESGHTYVVVLDGTKFGTFVWKGQAEIDLTTLAPDAGRGGVWSGARDAVLDAPAPRTSDVPQNPVPTEQPK